MFFASCAAAAVFKSFVCLHRKSCFGLIHCANSCKKNALRSLSARSGKKKSSSTEEKGIDVGTFSHIFLSFDLDIFLKV